MARVAGSVTGYWVANWPRLWAEDAVVRPAPRPVLGQGRSNSPSLTPRVNASHSSGVNASTGPSGFEESRIRYSFSASALCGQREVSVVTVTSTQQGPVPQWLARRQPEVCVSTTPGYCARSVPRGALRPAPSNPG